MQRKRNSFLTFCFSCMPGAGQMFLGFFKEGTSLMLMFLGIVFIASFFHIDALLIVVPVIWFYAFFDALNKNSLTDEVFEQLEDHYLFVNGIDEFKGVPFSKYRTVAAVLIILFGINLLFNNIVDLLFIFGISISYEMNQLLFDYIPQIIIAFIIIAAGVYLITFKKHSLEQDTNEDETLFSDVSPDENNGGEW